MRLWCALRRGARFAVCVVGRASARRGCPPRRPLVARTNNKITRIWRHYSKKEGGGDQESPPIGRYWSRCETQKDDLFVILWKGTWLFGEWEGGLVGWDERSRGLNKDLLLLLLLIVWGWEKKGKGCFLGREDEALMATSSFFLEIWE